MLDAMLAEVAGDRIAEANAKATGAVKRQVIRDHLDGDGGRTQVHHWVPRWLRFPATGYTDRGGIGSVARSQAIAASIASLVPPPERSQPSVAPSSAPLARAA